MEELSLRERKKLETRRNLIEAARKLFQDKGFDATLLEDIAERANVSRATLFNYFPSKDSLLADIATEEMEALVCRLDQGMAGEKRALAKLRWVMRLLVSDSSLLQVTRRVILETMLRPNEIPEPVARMESLLVDLVSQAQAEGDIRADLAAQDLARWVVGAYLAALTFHRWLQADQSEPNVASKEIEKSVHMLFEGVAGPHYLTGGER